MNVLVYDVAKSLLCSLGSKLGNEVGCRAILKVCGERMPTYFTEVYAEIQKIVDQELSKHQMDTIDSKINSLFQWVKAVYIPRKKSGVSKEKLFALLQSHVDDFYINVLGLLEGEKMASPGLGVFVVGASMHLLLLEELALVDPEVDDPNQSSYCETIQTFADRHASHVEKTFKKIVENRKRAITTSSTALSPFYRNQKYKGIWIWKDTLREDGEKEIECGVYEKPLYIASESTIGLAGTRGYQLTEEAKRIRSPYVAKQLAKLTESLNDPENAAAIWRSAARRPLKPTALEDYNMNVLENSSRTTSPNPSSDSETDDCIESETSL